MNKKNTSINYEWKNFNFDDFLKNHEDILSKITIILNRYNNIQKNIEVQNKKTINKSIVNLINLEKYTNEQLKDLLDKLNKKYDNKIFNEQYLYLCVVDEILKRYNKEYIYSPLKKLLTL